jgi:hypothetical protein
VWRIGNWREVETGSKLMSLSGSWKQSELRKFGGQANKWKRAARDSYVFLAFFCKSGVLRCTITRLSRALITHIFEAMADNLDAIVGLPSRNCRTGSL